MGCSIGLQNLYPNLPFDFRVEPTNRRAKSLGLLLHGAHLHVAILLHHAIFLHHAVVLHHAAFRAHVALVHGMTFHHLVSAHHGMTLHLAHHGRLLIHAAHLVLLVLSECDASENQCRYDYEA